MKLLTRPRSWVDLKPSERLTQAWTAAKLSGSHTQHEWVHECGTPACLAGWLVYLCPFLDIKSYTTPDGIEHRAKITKGTEGYGSVYWVTAALMALGVDRDDCEWLNPATSVDHPFSVMMVSPLHEPTDESVGDLGSKLDAYMMVQEQQKKIVWAAMAPSERLKTAWERARAAAGVEDRPLGSLGYDCGTPNRLAEWIVRLSPSGRIHRWEQNEREERVTPFVGDESQYWEMAGFLCLGIGRPTAVRLVREKLVATAVDQPFMMPKTLFAHSHNMTDRSIADIGHQLDYINRREVGER